MERKLILPGAHPRLKARQVRRGRTLQGSAITLNETMFEVVSLEIKGDDYIYTLTPWPENNKIKHHITWTAEHEELFRMECLFREKVDSTPRLLLGTLILVGFLPGSTQEDLSSRWEFDPAKATLYSAILEFAISFPIFIYETILHITGRTLMPTAVWLIIGYLALEGALRAGASLFLNEPVGILLLFFLKKSSHDENEEDHFLDKVTVGEHELHLTTHFPKVSLERAPRVHYQGRYYRFTEKKTLKFTSIYRFTETIEGVNSLELSLDLEREKNVAADRTIVFSPLWGFLSKKWQMQIAVPGLYRPLRFTLFSILCILFLFIPVMIFELAQWALDGPTYLVFIRLPIALYFIQESLARTIRLIKDKEPSGSLLGILLVPLARRYFQGVLSS